MIFIQGFTPNMTRPSTALLVLMICGNIHKSLDQPVLVKVSMQDLMRDILKRPEDTVENKRWWLVNPTQVDAQLMNLMKEKLERKMLKKAWQNFLSGEPNILQRMTKRRYNRMSYNNQKTVESKMKPRKMMIETIRNAKH